MKKIIIPVKGKVFASTFAQIAGSLLEFTTNIITLYADLSIADITIPTPAIGITTTGVILVIAITTALSHVAEINAKTKVDTNTTKSVDSARRVRPTAAPSIQYCPALTAALLITTKNRPKLTISELCHYSLISYN